MKNRGIHHMREQIVSAIVGAIITVFFIISFSSWEFFDTR